MVFLISYRAYPLCEYNRRAYSVYKSIMIIKLVSLNKMHMQKTTCGESNYRQLQKILICLFRCSIVLLFLLLGVYNLILYLCQVSIVVLRLKYDAATTEYLIVFCNELVSSYDFYHAGKMTLYFIEKKTFGVKNGLTMHYWLVNQS